MTGRAEPGAIRSIDVADLASGEQIRAAVSRELMDSLKTGFVYVRHDLTAGLLEESFDALGQFFALSGSEKASHTPHEVGDNSGYRALSTERAVGAPVADWKEAFQWCSALPAGHPLRTEFPHRYAETGFPEDAVPGISAVLRALQEQMFACQLAVMRAIVDGLGGAPSLADDLLIDADLVTRALHYPPLPDTRPAGLTWADAHVDINLITVLPPASRPGLEVATDAGWVAADPPEGHLVLNTGIMLDRLSNGLVPAGFHRVLPPEPGVERYSIAQFCHPAPWTVLSPLQSTVTADHPQRFQPMRSCDLLARTLWEIRETPAPPASDSTGSLR